VRSAEQSKRDNGAREADLARLYADFGASTFVFFLRKVRDPVKAADLNQDLYLRLSRSISTFEGRCSWRTWVFLIARNVLAERRGRWWKRLGDRTVDLDVGELVKDLDFQSSPDDQAAAVLLRSRLKRCLRLLDDRARAVIVGHYFDDVTLRELTERLGFTNPSGSRAILIAALRKLRRCLEGEAKP